MTPENVTRISLLLVLSWQIMHLYVRSWDNWSVGRSRRSTQAESRGQRQRKKAATPFGGLTRRPECALCNAESGAHAHESPHVPPRPIVRGRGRKPEIDTHQHFCPYRDCAYYGWLGLGNIIANGHPSGGPWRQLQCVVCGRYFQETLGTVFYGSPLPAETIMRALVALCEGVSPRKVARIFAVDKDTVLAWLAAAAEHSEMVLGYMLHHLTLTQVQMDELYALLRGIREDGKRQVCWVWTAMDALTKLWVAVVVGDRSESMAHRLVHRAVQVLAPGVFPLFLTDQLAAYGKALLGHFGYWVEQTSEKSKRILHRWMPVAQLRYAQVVKQQRRHKIVGVTTRVVFGTAQAINAALTAAGHKINTAFVERLNRTLQAHVPGLGRRAEDLARTQAGLQRRLHLVMGITTSVSRTCRCGRPCHSRFPPKVRVRPNGGTRVPRRWPPGSLTMCGRCPSFYSGVFRRGRRKRHPPRSDCIRGGNSATAQSSEPCPLAKMREEVAEKPAMGRAGAFLAFIAYALFPLAAADLSAARWDTTVVAASKRLDKVGDIFSSPH